MSVLLCQVSLVVLTPTSIDISRVTTWLTWLQEGVKRPDTRRETPQGWDAIVARCADRETDIKDDEGILYDYYGMRYGTSQSAPMLDRQDPIDSVLEEPTAARDYQFECVGGSRLGCLCLCLCLFLCSYLCSFFVCCFLRFVFCVWDS